jgi:hypothetical protein
MERQFGAPHAISTIGIEDMAPKDIFSKDMTSKDVVSNWPGFASCPHCSQPIRYVLSVLRNAL